MIYPRWHIDPRNVLAYLPGALLLVLLALAWWKRHTWGRPIVMLLVCYVGLLLPVLGFVNIYFMLYSFVADHYQYAAMIVPCLVCPAQRQRCFSGWTAAGLATCWGRRCWSVGVSYLAAERRIYADQETLYRARIKENPDCWLAYNNLGFALALRGKGDEAIPLFRKALELRPDYPEANYNLGIELAQRGELRKPSPSIERRSSSIRSTSRPIKISAWRWPAAAKPTRRLSSSRKPGHRAGLRRGPLQPGPRVGRPRRDRRSHCRISESDRLAARLRRRAEQPRRRVGQPRQFRRGHRSTRAQNQSQRRHRAAKSGSRPGQVALNFCVGVIELGPRFSNSRATRLFVRSRARRKRLCANAAPLPSRLLPCAAL